MSDLVDPQPDLQEVAHHPRDALAVATRTSLLAGTGGLLVAAVQNTLSRRSVGALGVFTQFGTTVGLYTGMGASYAFISIAAANLRERDDPYNQFMGGFAAGALSGIARRSAASALGRGTALGAMLALVQYAGGTLLGQAVAPPDEGRWPTKEELRKRFRRPYQETINELGEGRGIYGPNYEERRRQRLKDNYGIEVADPYYKSSSR